MRYEYRLKWRREGRDWVYRIYQTEAAARRKVDGILALEEIKPDTRTWENLPDLVGVPELQVREVGEWETAPAPRSEPSDAARKGVSEWAGVGEDHELKWGGAFDYVPLDPSDVPF